MIKSSCNVWLPINTSTQQQLKMIESIRTDTTEFGASRL